jgi:hypothetical protein
VSPHVDEANLSPTSGAVSVAPGVSEPSTAGDKETERSDGKPDDDDLSQPHYTPHPTELQIDAESKVKTPPSSPTMPRAATSPLPHNDASTVHLPAEAVETESQDQKRRGSGCTIDDSTGSVESFGTVSTMASAGGGVTYRKSRFHRPAFLKRFIHKAKDSMLPPIQS